mmetsp:Transcript_716/g.1337  ORF Transcript_716/g.1337 Transcript_716/m.1337 type:complete len:237 (-) Transcript_716:395-1105(-)
MDSDSSHSSVGRDERQGQRPHSKDSSVQLTLALRGVVGQGLVEQLAHERAGSAVLANNRRAVRQAVAVRHHFAEPGYILLQGAAVQRQLQRRPHQLSGEALPSPHHSALVHAERATCSAVADDLDGVASLCQPGWVCDGGSSRRRHQQRGCEHQIGAKISLDLVQRQCAWRLARHQVLHTFGVGDGWHVPDKRYRRGHNSSENNQTPTLCSTRELEVAAARESVSGVLGRASAAVG